MGSWWAVRRVVFFALAWLALGLAAFNASQVSEDRRVSHFLGGAIWSVLFLAVALWPRRKPPERLRSKPKRAVT